MPASSPIIAVIGAGSWGTALAVLLARQGADVRLWGHDAQHVARLTTQRVNEQFLPGVRLPSALIPAAELARAIDGADEILVVVPSQAFAQVLSEIAKNSPSVRSISWATKGFEPQRGLLLHEVARQRFPVAALAVLSGPTFAGEVARGLPTAITVASTDPEHAGRLAGYLSGASFRAYTSADIIGVQVGGAAKNVMAIAAGISDGLGFGANARAALITRGLAEITRLGVALGAEQETFMGLAGLGDLALTCTDNQSRNRRMGLALATGRSIQTARMDIGQEVEGVGTAREVYHRSQRLQVEMPITEQTYLVLYEGLAPKTAVRRLLERRPKAETE